MKIQNIILAILICTSTFTFAQSSKDNLKLSVDGVCNMCKKRIEDAAYKVKGVLYADWSPDTKLLEVEFRNNRTSQEAIEEAISLVGHDTKNFSSPDSIYSKMHDCCRYRVQQSH